MLIAVFCNFANAPKNGQQLIKLVFRPLRYRSNTDIWIYLKFSLVNLLFSYRHKRSNVSTATLCVFYKFAITTSSRDYATFQPTFEMKRRNQSKLLKEDEK
jgi:hypothetical protein